MALRLFKSGDVVMPSSWRSEGRARKFTAIAWVITASIAGSAASAPSPRANEEIKRFELHIEKGRLIDGLKTIRVTLNDPVEITWYADRPTAVHLHGYDLEITADAERSQTMSFKAHATGRFAIEMHGSTDRRHTVLIYLEVYPR
jgi:hypothetical protein